MPRRSSPVPFAASVAATVAPAAPPPLGTGAAPPRTLLAAVAAVCRLRRPAPRAATGGARMRHAVGRVSQRWAVGRRRRQKNRAAPRRALTPPRWRTGKWYTQAEEQTTSPSQQSGGGGGGGVSPAARGRGSGSARDSCLLMRVSQNIAITTTSFLEFNQHHLTSTMQSAYILVVLLNIESMTLLKYSEFHHWVGCVSTSPTFIRCIASLLKRVPSSCAPGRLFASFPTRFVLVHVYTLPCLAYAAVCHYGLFRAPLPAALTGFCRRGRGCGRCCGCSCGPRQASRRCRRPRPRCPPRRVRLLP